MGKFADLAMTALPTFKCLVPSLGKTKTLRSFVVKEQKLLLIAKQSEGDGNSIDGIVDAVTQLIQNCVVDDLKVSELPAFDIEYMFIQLSMHSTGTRRTKAHFRCLAPVKDEEGKAIIDSEGNAVLCEEPNQVFIDLASAKVPTADIRTGIIEINNKAFDKLILTYPTFEQSARHDLALANDDPDGTFRMYGECLKFVYKADGTVMALGEDYQVDDAIELLEMLPGDQFEKVSNFFEKIPTVTAELDFKCRKCNHESKINLRGLQDFF